MMALSVGRLTPNATASFAFGMDCTSNASLTRSIIARHQWRHVGELRRVQPYRALGVVMVPVVAHRERTNAIRQPLAGKRFDDENVSASFHI